MKALKSLLAVVAILLTTTLVHAVDSEVGQILRGNHKLGKVGVLATMIVPELSTAKYVNSDS